MNCSLENDPNDKINKNWPTTYSNINSSSNQSSQNYDSQSNSSQENRSNKMDNERFSNNIWRFIKRKFNHLAAFNIKRTFGCGKEIFNISIQSTDFNIIIHYIEDKVFLVSGNSELSKMFENDFSIKDFTLSTRVGSSKNFNGNGI